jgi:uncharacterized protein YndB with AHSA1/START domain
MQTELFNVPADREIVSTRILKTMPDSVFNAWTDPELLQQWWGPAGFTNTFEIFDLRVGGRWKFVMHGPGGVGNYKNECEFLVIDKPNLLVWQRISQPLFRVVTTFDETADGNTNLVFRMQFETKELCDKIRGFAPDKNEENFDKLEAVLHLQ